MKRMHVNSATLTSVGYDKLKQVLEVQFTSGNVYQYLHVPYQIYKDLLAAESIGAFFNLQVKRFPFVKVK